MKKKILSPPPKLQNNKKIKLFALQEQNEDSANGKI